MAERETKQVELAGVLEEIGVGKPEYLFEAPYTASVRAVVGDYDWIIKVGAFDLEELDGKIEELTVWLEVREAKPKVTGAAKDAETGEVMFEAVQVKFERTESGKYRIAFYRMYGDEVGQYPDLSETLPREEMWEKYKIVLSGQNLKELPVKFPWSGRVYWKRGRPTGKTDSEGNPTYFKDITRVEPL